MAEKRISGKIGDIITLNVTFYKNGTPQVPFAIRRIDIYKDSLSAANKVAEIPIPLPSESLYPAPIEYGDANSDGTITTGELVLNWDVPLDLTPGLYFDVWYFIPNDPGTGADLDDETIWQKCCHKFWLYEGGFYCTDNLESIKFGYEALDIKFRKPEVRHFEVGVMPLPLYDFDQDLFFPAFLKSTATISIQSLNCEPLVVDAPMTIGLRQGHYRSNPFVYKYLLDTNDFLIGTYKARITSTLPDSTVIVSPDIFFEVV